jgi:hypothetical protein
MKKLLTATMLTLSLTSWAQSKTDERCSELAEFSQTVMEARQRGIDMQRLIQLSQGNELAIRIIIEAYDVPRYRTSEYQQNAVTEFANKIQVTCYKALIKKTS